MRPTPRQLSWIGGALALLNSAPTHATCSDSPMLASICITAASYCPRGYAEARGQILPISQNTALFSLIGPTYGGDGKTTFALPDLRGRVPVGVGQGQGMTAIALGEIGGGETVSIKTEQLPAHTHVAHLKGTDSTGNADSPIGSALAKLPRSNNYHSTELPAGALSGASVSVEPTGGGQPLNVRNPFMGLMYCLAMDGIYPAR